MTKNVVYLVHGGKKFYDQARMSILTLLDLLIKQQHHEYSINVYCDRPELLPQHAFVHHFIITSEQFACWRGPLDYVHRIKLEILRYAASRMLEPFIYVDCDTRWLQLPDTEFLTLGDYAPPAKPVLFMHMNDGEISAHFYPHYFSYLNRFAADQLAPWNVKSGPWAMWNSGVIGVSPKETGTFFDDALAICDLLLPYLRPRSFVEQCALALLAGSRFDVQPFDHCLHHYWNHSYEAPIYLNTIFRKMDSSLKIEQQADFCGRLKWDNSLLRALQDAPIHRFRRWIAKQKNSYYKRKIDLKAAKLRRNLGR